MGFRLRIFLLAFGLPPCGVGTCFGMWRIFGYVYVFGYLDLAFLSLYGYGLSSSFVPAFFISMHICICMYVCMYDCVCMNVCFNECIRMYVCMHECICMNVRTYAEMYECGHVCVYGHRF